MTIKLQRYLISTGLHYFTEMLSVSKLLFLRKVFKFQDHLKLLINSTL